MNENLHTDGVSNVPWPAGDSPPRTPSSPMLTPGDPSAPAVGLLKNAVQGAHDTIDRLADRAEPAARRLGERVADAEAALHEKTVQWRTTRDLWAEDLRGTVRSRPLAWLAAAFALGAVLARVTR